jgi:magnesium transporter
MRKKIISIPKHWNIAKITSFCYENKAILSDDFYKIYVVDHRHKPIGSLLISRLLTHHSKEIAADIMNKEVMAINTDMNEEEVALLFHKYGIVSAPVINEHGRMVGEITIDDIVNIIREVAEDDILHLGGVNESDIFSSFLNTTKKRFPWLFVNMLTAIIASMVIATFDTAIQNLVVLAVLMPIIASMGGNAGTQTVTVAVRSLAMREINESNYFSIIRKETLVGLLNGLLFGGLMGVAIFFIYDSSFLGILFSAATLMTLVFAGFFGALIPIILTKLKADPAVSSVVFLTTITDVAAFFGFLGLATLFIK